MTGILLALFIVMLVVCGIAAIIVAHTPQLDEDEPIEHPVSPESRWGRYVAGEDVE